MQKFDRVVRNPKRSFTDFECDRLAETMAAADSSAIMTDVPVGTVFWLQFDPTHNALNSMDSPQIEGEMWNRYTPATDLQGVYAEEGGWLYDGDKFALHESGGLPRFDLGGDAKREIMKDFRGNENSFLRRMHLLACQIHNKLVDDYGYDFETARRANIAITNRITYEQTELLAGTAATDAWRSINRLVDLKFHNSLEWNFAAARYAHAMCPASVQGDDPLIKGRLALDVDIVALFDGSEPAKALTPSISLAMQDMTSVPMKKNIIKRTLNRSVQLGLPSFGELAKTASVKVDEDLQDLPIWVGMLEEAAREQEGQRLGSFGSALVWAGNFGAMKELEASKDGLWYDLDDELPDTIESTLAWLGLL